MILVVVFVVLMILWAFSAWSSSQPGANPAFGHLNHAIPWICVAILGYYLFGGITPPRF